MLNLVFVIVGLLVVIIGLQYLGLYYVKYKLSKLSLDKETINKMYEQFSSSLLKEIKTLPYSLSAPIVMLFVLPFVPKTATKLPSAFSKWDNDISINGDSGGILKDGQWIDWRDIKDPTQYEGLLSVSYDDPRYTGDAYYAKGHNPRSFWARYIWLGWRNRASKLSLDGGVDIIDVPTIVINDPRDYSTASPGYFILKAPTTDDVVYQYKSYERVSKFMFIQSFGYKLDIPYKGVKSGHVSINGKYRASFVAIGFSLKGAKSA